MPSHRRFQILRLRLRSDGGNLYDGVYVYGSPRRPFRGVLAAGGAVLPAGGTDFDVPAGRVRIGDILRFRAQHFEVTALTPLTGMFRRVLAETEQRPGAFPTEFPHLEWEGVTPTWEGETLEWSADG